MGSTAEGAVWSSRHPRKGKASGSDTQVSALLFRSARHQARGVCGPKSNGTAAMAHLSTTILFHQMCTVFYGYVVLSDSIKNCMCIQKTITCTTDQMKYWSQPEFTCLWYVPSFYISRTATGCWRKNHETALQVWQAALREPLDVHEVEGGRVPGARAMQVAPQLLLRPAFALTRCSSNGLFCPDAAMKLSFHGRSPMLVLLWFATVASIP